MLEFVSLELKDGRVGWFVQHKHSAITFGLKPNF